MALRDFFPWRQPRSHTALLNETIDGLNAKVAGFAKDNAILREANRESSALVRKFRRERDEARDKLARMMNRGANGRFVKKS